MLNGVFIHYIYVVLSLSLFLDNYIEVNDFFPEWQLNID